MSRYAKLVEQALRDQPGFVNAFDLRTVRLSSPRVLLGRLSTRLWNWFNHFWLMFTGPARIKRYKADLVHILDGSYGYLCSDLGDPRVVATVHDLVPLLQQKGKLGPDRTSFLARWIVKRSVGGLGKCACLIAVSLNTRKDIDESTPIRCRCLSVVPNALDSVYVTELENVQSESAKANRGLSPTILHVGHNGHYKNRVGALRIFWQVRQMVDCRLLMVGARPSESVLSLVRKLGLANDVEFVGEVNDSDLRDLYRRSSLLLFPSLYEGFGWPPLEAMACGCPVVCSTEGSLDEVVADAALKAPARDEGELAKLCLAVLQDGELAETLIAKGRRHASQFTSARMGAQLLAVYRQALGLESTLQPQQTTAAL